MTDVMIGGADQWDVVRTIHELEQLQERVRLCIEHTSQRLGTIGSGPAGEQIMEHPLGRAVFSIEEALRACYGKYGRDLYSEARSLNGAISTTDEED